MNRPCKFDKKSPNSPLFLKKLGIVNFFISANVYFSIYDYKIFNTESDMSELWPDHVKEWFCKEIVLRPLLLLYSTLCGNDRAREY